jgi:hypothetical protein
MSDGIDIKGIDKAELLAGLFNRSKPLGLGFLQGTPQEMTVEEARDIIASGQLDFDYLKGRPMKINIDGDTLNTWGYDGKLGKGVGQSVVEALRAGQPVPKNPDSLTGDLEALIAAAKPSTIKDDGKTVSVELGTGDMVEYLEQRRSVFRPKSAETGRASFKSQNPLNEKERITADMTIGQAIAELTEGDPTSMRLLQLYAETVPMIDPYSIAIDGMDFMTLLQIDMQRLYGTRISTLYKMCEENMEKMATVGRGCQLGIISKQELHKNIEAMNNCGHHDLDVDAVIRQVQARIPGYLEIVPNIAGNPSEGSKKGQAPEV